MDYFLLRIKAIIPQPGENLTLELEDTDKPFPPYLAGQFLTLVFRWGEREVRRSYSLHSAPGSGEPLSITVKRVENGEISRWLHQKATVGDLLTVLPPQGIFTYKPEEGKKRKLFLFAAGVGITPLFAILKTALSQESDSEVVLIYSNRSPDTALFLPELEAWEQRYTHRLTVIRIFSNRQNLLKARLNRFYLEEIVREHLKGPGSDARFYTCGPVSYMDLCRITLLGLGFDPGQIKRETFFLPEDEADDDDETEKTVDTTTYPVRIYFLGRMHSLMIPYDRSILDVALQERIPLPYSCRSGMCSACMAYCVSGAVRMDYNEVLTDRDVAQGKILVCTAHPLGNDTVIRYDAPAADS